MTRYNQPGTMLISVIFFTMEIYSETYFVLLQTIKSVRGVFESKWPQQLTTDPDNICQDY
ncbi:MAG TPA: hypothetical protein VHQ93_05390 [Chitinophagaceae bacterium]|jgi:hypothetical protein|nr:hypothetical protein [Chitinophagaceae bacterium]